MRVRIAAAAERAAVVARLVAEWGEPMLARGRAWRLEDCVLFVAGDMEGLAAVCGDEAPMLELVAINAFQPRLGIGTALIAAISAHARRLGFEAIRLATTNDNTDALRFYQRRGFRLVALRPGAVDEARRLKPSIPLLGDHDVPLRDELDLMLPLSSAPHGLHQEP